jgi:hypothetical protein
MLAVAYACIPARAADASFTFDPPPSGSIAESVRRWKDSAAAFRTSDRTAPAGDAALGVSVPPPLKTPTCSPTITVDCISPDGLTYFEGSRPIRIPTVKESLPVPEPSVVIEFVPLRLASTEASAGPSKDRAAGVWSVYVCNNTNARVVVPRARVFMTSPHILPLSDGQAAALLDNRTQKNGKQIFWRAWSKLSPIAGGIGGMIVAGPVGATAVGFGLQGLNDLASWSKESAPQYKLFAPLPAQIVLEPKGTMGECAEHDLLSGRIHGAARHKGWIQ